MTVSRRLAVKLAAALLAGLPLTAIPLFYLAWGFFAGLEGLVAPPGSRAVRAGALTLLWSLGGFLGIAGFWAWVFLARSARRRTRFLIAVLLVAGLASLAATLPPSSTEGALLALGAALALGVPCVLLLRPDLAWNPDRPGGT